MNRLFLLLPLAACGRSGQPDNAADAATADGAVPSCKRKWTLHDLDAADTVTQANAIAVEPNGTLHAVYGTDAGLRYARKPPSADWSIEPIESSSKALSARIAVDAMGGVHVSSFDFANGLSYARRDGGTWSIEQVTPLVDGAGYNHALAVDGNAGMHSLYSSNTQTLYARRAGGSFPSEKLDDTMGSPTDIAIDANGVIHTVYSPCGSPCGSGYPLTYARRVGETWQRETVDDDNMAGAALVVQPGGEIAIAFYLFANAGDQLRFAQRDGNGWTVERVDPKSYSTGGNISIVAEPSGDIHVLYHYSDTSELRHAYRHNGMWSLAPVDMFGDAGEASSLARGPDGTLHATYYRCTDTFCDDDAIKYAVWECE